VGQHIFNVIRAHALRVESEKHLNVRWDDLGYLIHNIPLGENIFLGG